MNKITVSRQQYERLAAALLVCEGSGQSPEIKALVFVAAAKGILGAEQIDAVLSSGGKVEEMVVVDNERQVSVSQWRGRAVVIEMRQSRKSSN
jgi:hypothetical protein